MRKPDFVIGGSDNPYMFRWYIIPRNTFLNIYLHKFLRDDEDRALHDHPWWFVSFLLKGTYKEVLKDDSRCRACGGDCYNFKPKNCPACGEAMFQESKWRRRFGIVLRPATHRHRVVLKKDSAGNPLPCWTIVVTGPRIREWGFWCPRGFVSWKLFTKPNNPGEVGRGCGEGDLK